MQAYDILKFTLSTEKAVRDMEAENCLIFVVSKNATKKDIKWAAEKAFQVKVINVRTQNAINGQKRAFIKLSQETPAADITAKLGLV
jgi:ribosomal protein L23